MSTREDLPVWEIDYRSTIPLKCKTSYAQVHIGYEDYKVLCVKIYMQDFVFTLTESSHSSGYSHRIESEDGTHLREASYQDITMVQAALDQINSHTGGPSSKRARNIWLSAMAVLHKPFIAI